MATSSSDSEADNTAKASLEAHLLTINDPKASDALALKYRKEFQESHDETLMDLAILCNSRTLEICPPDNPRKTRYYVRAASYLESRHRRSSKPDRNDLVKAHEYLSLAAETSGVQSEPAREG